MGLTAVVYRNRKAFIGKDGALYSDLDFDEETGEVFPKDDTSTTYSKDMFITDKKRIGNVAAVAIARSTLIRIGIDEDSVLLSKVLYSGTHGGDLLNLSDVDLLDHELQNVQVLIEDKTLFDTEEDDSEALSQLISDFNDLIQASREEGNPIVFI